MDLFRQQWTQVQSQVSDWSFTTKWLIGALVVILVLVGVLFVNLASAPQMVPISQVADGGTPQIVAHLQADGIEHEQRGGQVYVPVKDQERAIATLAVNNLISRDAYAAFDSLINNQSWMTTNRQSDQQMRMATGRFLGMVVGEFPGVDHAYVVIDKPDTVGIGLGYVPPSAMVTVSMESGKVDRRMADALISLVEGAVAELPAENIKVIDATNRREWSAQDEEGIDAGTHLEHLVAQERLHKTKIEEVLRSFAGATVAVKIVTSQTVREQRHSTTFDETSRPLRERTMEMTNTHATQAGEAGVRPNVGVSIDGGGAVGTESNTNESEVEFYEPGVTVRSTQDIAGSAIRLINVSVAIPRSYFVQVYQAQNGGSMSEEPPTDDDLKAIIDAEKAKITELITPQLVAMPGEGEVSAAQPGSINVQMVYDQAYLEPVAASSTGGLGAVMSSDWAPMAMVGSLAVISLVFMFGLVKKATKTEDMPTIEELAGVPPTLPTDDDLMGEVDEMDGGLAGVELEEGELRSRQIAEQISELVKANPEEAGGLLGKWVGTEKL